LQPAEADKYALFRNNAKLIRRDVTSTIYLDNKIDYQEQRKRAIKKGIKNNLVVEQSTNYIEYWNLLTTTLATQHDTKPVHSLEEIIYLVNVFPNNIKLYVAKNEEKILGGTVIFENDKIAHTQYLANSIYGREIGALDLVIDHLITEVYKNKKYFDFGISNENNGLYLNTGLIAQKEGFGGRAVVHDVYELSFGFV
jgi:predicted N-acyltransferase